MREIRKTESFYSDSSLTNINNNLSATTTSSESSEKKSIFDIDGNDLLRAAAAFVLGPTVGLPLSPETSIFAGKVSGEIDEVDEFTSDTVDATVSPFKSDSVSDFVNKQNYIAGNLFSEVNSGDTGFNEIMQLFKNSDENWDSIKENTSEYKYVDSNLSDEEQKQAREYAISLLESRLEELENNMPEYGDVKSYYNEGSLLDWVVTHPISFGANAISEASENDGYVDIDKVDGNNASGDNWYKHFSQDILGKDGMFTLQNIPSYIAHANDGEIRQDSFWDMFSIKSTENINKELEEYKSNLEMLKNNIDNPEEFSKIYYNITEGVNFDADKILEYKENATDDANDEGIIGRNYINEDIGKNKFGTNIIYDVNKTVGTALLSKLAHCPAGAYLVNVVVSALEKNTDGTALTENEAKDILVEEFIRTFCVSGMASKYINELPWLEKLPSGLKSVAEKALTKGSNWLTKLTSKLLDN